MFHHVAYNGKMLSNGAPIECISVSRVRLCDAVDTL